MASKVCVKFENSKWPPFLAKQNFWKITTQRYLAGSKISSKSLCLARFAIFCEKFENLKWLLFLARQNCFLHWDGYSTKISCGSKIWSQSLYLAWLLRYKRFCVLPILRKILNCQRSIPGVIRKTKCGAGEA